MALCLSRMKGCWGLYTHALEDSHSGEGVSLLPPYLTNTPTFLPPMPGLPPSLPCHYSLSSLLYIVIVKFILSCYLQVRVLHPPLFPFYPDVLPLLYIFCLSVFIRFLSLAPRLRKIYWKCWRLLLSIFFLDSYHCCVPEVGPNISC